MDGSAMFSGQRILHTDSVMGLAGAPISNPCPLGLPEESTVAHIYVVMYSALKPAVLRVPTAIGRCAFCSGAAPFDKLRDVRPTWEAPGLKQSFTKRRRDDQLLDTHLLAGWSWVGFEVGQGLVGVR